jgi:hypothetical protein
MTELRPLRGGCQCGRNRYIIAVPQTSIDEAMVHFNTEPIHRMYTLIYLAGSCNGPSSALPLGRHGAAASASR